jgi:zinc protease
VTDPAFTQPRLSPPPVAPPRTVRLPTVAERTLPSGLRVLAVRRSSVPLVELRLRIPLPGVAGRAGERHAAGVTMLAETLLTGTHRRDRLGLATALQALGGALTASVDPDRLLISGSALAAGLADVLDLLAEVLTGATYPTDEVIGERDRVGQEITIARSQPGVLAREALLHRLYPGHPYALELPAAAAVAAVGPPALRRLHAGRVSPTGATLVLVGDLRPAAALDTAESALGDWPGRPGGAAVPPVPELAAGPVQIVDRPGAVQTNIRLAGPALDRRDPSYAAQQLANTVYGGYFTSRLVANIREDKGYTYSPRSAVEHLSAASRLGVAADVATEVTAPALLEIWYELGRLCLLPVGADELEAARRYATGSLALSTATQAGLASVLSGLVGAGLGIGYLREHPAALAKVTPADLLEVAGRLFAPARLVGVLLGDAERIRGPLGTLAEVAVPPR